MRSDRAFSLVLAVILDFQIISSSSLILVPLAVLIYIAEQDYLQCCAGIGLVFAFLLLSMRRQPYAVPVLNTLQAYSLVVLMIVLFYGLLKTITDKQNAYEPRMEQDSLDGGAYGRNTLFSTLIMVLCATVSRL